MKMKCYISRRRKKVNPVRRKFSEDFLKDWATALFSKDRQDFKFEWKVPVYMKL